MITKHYEIDAPISEVWKALVDPNVIEQWGGGPVVMDDKVGTEFSLWGGDIHGKNIEVIPEKKLVQDCTLDNQLVVKLRLERKLQFLRQQRVSFLQERESIFI